MSWSDPQRAKNLLGQEKQKMLLESDTGHFSMIKYVVGFSFMASLLIDQGRFTLQI